MLKYVSICYLYFHFFKLILCIQLLFFSRANLLFFPSETLGFLNTLAAPLLCTDPRYPVVGLISLMALRATFVITEVGRLELQMVLLPSDCGSNSCTAVHVRFYHSGPFGLCSHPAVTLRLNVTANCWVSTGMLVSVEHKLACITWASRVANTTDVILSN